MKRVLAIALVVALLAVPVVGKLVETDSVIRDNQFLAVKGYLKGECLLTTSAKVRTDPVTKQLSVHGAARESAAVYWGPAGQPGWLNWQVGGALGTEGPTDVHYIAFRFKEIVPVHTIDSATPSYTWGDTLKVLVGDVYRSGAFEIALWDSVLVYLVGGAYNTAATVSIWTETN